MKTQGLPESLNDLPESLHDLPKSLHELGTTFQLRRFALNASESGFSLTFALLLSRFYTLFTRY